jgi:hypothetical protein
MLQARVIVLWRSLFINLAGVPFGLKHYNRSKRNVLGEETVSSHLVVGVANLPFGSPVELEFILEVRG